MIRIVKMPDGEVVSLMDFPRDNFARFRFLSEATAPFTEHEKDTMNAHRELFFSLNSDRHAVVQ